MPKNIYIGNLSYDTTPDRLQQAFEAYGEVTSVHIVTDRETGRSRGFGFVEMANDDEADQAISGLDGQPLDGRTLRVNEARPRAPRSSSGDRGGGRRRW